jgi:hypothetical protein
VRVAAGETGVQQRARRARGCSGARVGAAASQGGEEQAVEGIFGEPRRRRGADLRVARGGKGVVRASWGFGTRLALAG